MYFYFSQPQNIKYIGPAVICRNLLAFFAQLSTKK